MAAHNNGTRTNLFFSSEDLKVKDPFLRLFRLVFNRFGVTKNDFVELHSAYRRKFYPSDTKDQISTNRNNIRRTITEKPMVTWKQAYAIWTTILNLKVIRISVTVQNKKNGEITVINSDDAPGDDFRNEKSQLV